MRRYGAQARLRRTSPDTLVFTTSNGARRDKDNIREHVLAPVVARADELLAERGQHPLPRGVTPHKLRHNFASILSACGEEPATIMARLGHTDRLSRWPCTRT